MKNITFITTGQPTTNPRLVKEAETLIGLGYRVKVICCFYQSWAQKFDQEIISRNKNVYIYCGGDPEVHRAAYFKTRIRQKICSLLFGFTKALGVPENAISRTHAEALHLAKKIKTDLYIAHNLGALPAAVIAARYNNAKVGYDAEDMHSGQFVSNKDGMYLLNKYIEEKYFAQTDYFTAASPLIAKNYQNMYSCLNPVVINNVFPKTKLTLNLNYKTDRPLKLFWFSQTVGGDRGLEIIIAAMSLISKPTELHLLGSCLPADKQHILKSAKDNGIHENQIYFHRPIAAGDVIKLAARFDIGMATETASSLNRDICLTNKIFTYVQAGLAVIASDTQAQELFLEQYPDSGNLYHKNEVQSMANCINQYAENPESLYRIRELNYGLGQTTLNWETESKIFRNIVEQTLNNVQ
ncbi:glycosyltransferase [Mucilaginibacter lappiensis]|uniref:glycosyltransferase n=1 Tax=Mucilaginibacter lappiensis TaxID=354630 RepID=UPI003D1B7483